MLIRVFAIALLAASVVPTARAAEVKREALYDVVTDFNGDGTPDRAVLVLVGPGMAPDTSDLAKDRYGLAENERVDLAIYMGAANVPLDITKPPTFIKENVVDQSRYYTWALPLAINAAGSLMVSASVRWGSSHEEDETLTLQFVKAAAPRIIGYDYTAAVRDGEVGCSIDLLKGVAQHEAEDGTKKKSRVPAKLIPLANWKQPIWPQVCN